MHKTTPNNTHKTKGILAFVAISLFMFSCGSSNKKSSAMTNNTSKVSQEELAEGFELMKNNCYACHSPNATMENRIAPPMFAVKSHYIDSTTTLEQFTKEVATFIKNPSEDISKMPGAIRKFNLMPKYDISDEDIAKITSYIFYSEIEKPEWFDKHQKKHHKKQRGNH